MRIEAIDSQPYIYNTNQVSAASLNPVPPIPRDLEAEKTDFSDLARSRENVNPLKPGETAGYENVIDSQMRQSERNAARVMVAKADEPTAAEEVTAEMTDTAKRGADDGKAANVNAPGNAVTPATEETQEERATEAADAAEARFDTAAEANRNAANTEANLYQMRRASEAYATVMFTTAA